MNSSSGVCLPRLRHHSPAITKARSAAAPATHGQIEADEACAGAGSIALVGAGAAGSPEVLGSGAGVSVSLAGPDGAPDEATGAGAGAAVVRGNGASGRAGAVPRSAGAEVMGALGVAVGLAAGTGAGLGEGRGAGERMIGASLSTGPCARGLLVGREVGIEKSGTDCAGADPDASKSPSAIAPVAAFTLPPKSCIDCSIFLRPAR